MRIAYIISAYRKPEHLVRLIQRLHTGANTAFFVHVDAKTDEATNRSMVEGVRHLDHVRFLPRHRCHWGGFGHVAASLKGIQELLDSGFGADYAVLLSESDYPIKSNDFIRRFLAARDGRSFFMHFPLPSESWSGGGLPRIRDWHLRWRRLHLRLPLRRSLPLRLAPWGGSAYWCLSGHAVESVHRFVQDHPEYVRFFRHVDIPDETFFQTILLNSPLAGECDYVRLHYTEWNREPAPAVLTKDDYPHLAASDCLFARKFDPTVDEEVLDLIDENLL